MRVSEQAGGASEYAHRLERIEKRADELHNKMDEFVEAEAATATDIVWLTWAVRGC